MVELTETNNPVNITNALKNLALIDVAKDFASWAIRARNLKNATGIGRQVFRMQLGIAISELGFIADRLEKRFTPYFIEFEKSHFKEDILDPDKLTDAEIKNIEITVRNFGKLDVWLKKAFKNALEIADKKGYTIPDSWLRQIKDSQKKLDGQVKILSDTLGDLEEQRAKALEVRDDPVKIPDIPLLKELHTLGIPIDIPELERPQFEEFVSEAELAAKRVEVHEERVVAGAVELFKAAKDLRNDILESAEELKLDDKATQRALKNLLKQIKQFRVATWWDKKRTDVEGKDTLRAANELNDVLAALESVDRIVEKMPEDIKDAFARIKTASTGLKSLLSEERKEERRVELLVKAIKERAIKAHEGKKRAVEAAKGSSVSTVTAPAALAGATMRPAPARKTPPAAAPSIFNIGTTIQSRRLDTIGKELDAYLEETPRMRANLSDLKKALDEAIKNPTNTQYLTKLLRVLSKNYRADVPPLGHLASIVTNQAWGLAKVPTRDRPLTVK